MSYRERFKCTPNKYTHALVRPGNTIVQHVFQGEDLTKYTHALVRLGNTDIQHVLQGEIQVEYT